MSDSVGRRTIAYVATLLIPEGEDAHISFPVGTDTVNIRLRFVVDEKTLKVQRNIAIADDPELRGGGLLTFTNWKTRFGDSNSKPVEFATTDDGKKIYLLTYVSFEDGVYKLTIQFMVEDRHD